MSTFKHADGRVLSAYPGTALEEVLVLDAEWEAVDDDAVEVGSIEQPDKPLKKQNKDELKATAAARGIDLGDAETRAEILAAIENAHTGQTPAAGDGSFRGGGLEIDGEGRTLGEGD